MATANTNLPNPIDRNGAIRPIPILAPPQPRPHNALLVLHPNYGDASNIIFSLPCVDPVRQSDSPSSIHASATETTTLSPSYGVHHRTVLVAAQIVANNAFNGYLALDKEGLQPVLIPLEGILTGRKYFFIVPGDGTSSNALHAWRYAPMSPSLNSYSHPALL